jgi:hypothetical protein
VCTDACEPVFCDADLHSKLCTVDLRPVVPGLSYYSVLVVAGCIVQRQDAAGLGLLTVYVCSVAHVQFVTRDGMHPRAERERKTGLSHVHIMPLQVGLVEGRHCIRTVHRGACGHSVTFGHNNGNIAAEGCTGRMHQSGGEHSHHKLWQAMHSYDNFANVEGRHLGCLGRRLRDDGAIAGAVQRGLQSDSRVHVW